jgi:adenylate cyclase
VIVIDRAMDGRSTLEVSSNKTYKLLVVDDQEFFHRLLNGYLEGTGIAVKAAKSGEEALAMVRREVPDIVVTDISMPGGMNGLELCRHLKADPSTVSMPVVILSVRGDREDRIRGFEAGADDFFSKGMDREEFLVRLQSLLQLHQARRDLAAAQLAMEIQRGQALRDTFERYVSPKLVETILATPSLLEAARIDRNTRPIVTVMFADLRGFTRMSEQLEPDQVVLLLNEYFTLLTDCAYQNEGTIFNMAGDNLLVGFGAPIPQHDATPRAIRTGQRMLDEFARLAREWKVKHGVEVGLGIGINEGVAVAGNVGSPAYMNYTLIGDTVNTAARITQRARAGEMLFSERVMRSIRVMGISLEAVELPPMELKGKSETLKIFCMPTRYRPDLGSGEK